MAKYMPAFRMVTSQDNSAFAIIANTKNTEEINRMYVFNNNLEQKLIHNFNPDYSGNSYLSFSISADGKEVYLLVKMRTAKQNKKRKAANMNTVYLL